MEANTGYKFEPIWVSILSVISLILIFNFFKVFIAKPSYDFSGMVFLAPPVLMGLLFLPMGIKMLMGVSAITFTHDQLIDNVLGIKVDWDNVQNIRLSGDRKPFLAIDLKDTQKFYSAIKDPLKRILLRLLFAISPGDVSINLAFVAGDNAAIVGVTQVYWGKHYQTEA